MRATFHGHLILLDLIIVIISGEEYEAWKFRKYQETEIYENRTHISL
jgi:hypothetical protein